MTKNKWQLYSISKIIKLDQIDETGRWTASTTGRPFRSFSNRTEARNYMKTMGDRRYNFHLVYEGGFGQKIVTR